MRLSPRFPRFAPEPDWRTLAKRVAAFVAAGLAGLGFYVAHIPLAWVLGPLMMTAVLSMLGWPVLAPARGRHVGQLIIGAGLGLNITAALVTQIFGWVPLMIVTALSAILVTSFFSVLLARFGGLDRTTAYFAMMPGGLSEMANIGAVAGARSEPIALAQAVRLALVVCVLPPAIIALGISGDFKPYSVELQVPYIWVGVLMVVGLGGVRLMRLIGMNNPWMLGSLLAAAVLTTSGIVEGQMPRLIFYAGQFMLGLVIGARFQRDIVTRLPVLFALSLTFTFLITIVLFFLGATISHFSGLDLASAALASSAGGVAEMALTAQILQLNVALILAFHIIRALIVNGFCIHIFNLLEKVRYFGAIEKLVNAAVGAGPIR